MEGLEIHNAVIHQLVKEQHQRIQPSVTRSTVLDPAHDAVVSTISGVIAVYGKKNNSAHYGIFKTGEGRGAFPDAFEAYADLSEELPDENQFLDLSIIAMERLYDKASSETAASGGYILFADYSLGNQGRSFLIAMVKQKKGITLNSTLEPEELMHLDLSRLNQAAKVSFLKLRDYLNTPPSDRAELGNYLSFVSSGSTKTASGYFVMALGCSEGTASAQATRTLVQETRRFFRETEGLSSSRNAFNKSLVEYLGRKENTRTSVKLVEIEQIIRRHIPDEMAERADELAEEILARLNSEEFSVPVEFPVSKSALTRITQIKGGTDSWSMSFDKGALGDAPGADIYYDRDNELLIIQNIPEGLKEMVLSELDSRNGV